MTDQKTLIKSIAKKIGKSEKLSLIIALVTMIVIFSILTDGKYILVANILNILIASSIVGLVAIGECYSLIGGLADLSPGSISAFSGVLISVLLRNGVNMYLAILIVLACGALIGLFNAFMVNRMDIASFIATLATMSIFRGMAYIICGGKSVMINNADYIAIGTGRIFGIPNPVIILLVMFILAWIVLSKMRFGRMIYMIGGNATAARLAGINAKRIKTQLFVILAMLSALGGCILAARMNSGQPTASDGLEFVAITAAVLGGVAFTGGAGTLSGAMIGLLIIQGFNNGLLMLNIQSFWQIVLRGALLVMALSFDFLRKKGKIKAIQ